MLLCGLPLPLPSSSSPPLLRSRLWIVMEDLPQEIVLTTVSLVEDEGDWFEIREHGIPKLLGPYAAISCQWQHLVEAITFHDLVLTPMKLARCEQSNYFTSTLLSQIRSIEIHFIFLLSR